MMIGERTNVTGSKKFARLILDGNFEEAVDGGPRSRSTAARTSSTSTWTRGCSTAKRR